MKIAYYISDHGLGHAARSSAVIQQLLARKHSVIIRNNKATEFLKANLPIGSNPNLQLNSNKTDVGPLLATNSFSFDWLATTKAAEGYANQWNERVKTEKSFLLENKIELIIVDVVPHALIAANELGIKSVLLSNYSWHSIYYNKLPLELAKPFQEAYSLCNLQLELPFAIPNSGVKNKKQISLVARRKTISRREIRKKLNVVGKLIYFGFGGWNLNQRMEAKAIPGYEMIISGKQFSPLEANGQNYIAASDVAITKGGYGTVAEAIAANVPVVCATIPGSLESEIIAHAVEKERLGIAVKIEELTDINYLKESIEKAIEIYKKPTGKYAQVGEFEAVKEMEKLN